jgi:hypothetical protein
MHMRRAGQHSAPPLNCGVSRMPPTPRVQSAIRAFNDVILGGIPILLQRNETAFLSFMCGLAALDALSAYRYETNEVGKRFEDFIAGYFPATYTAHRHNLYLLRCRVLHNFSPAHFTLSHAAPSQHLQPSGIGDTVLSDESFYADLARAAGRFFSEVAVDPERQRVMDDRLGNIGAGGAIYT